MEVSFSSSFKRSFKKRVNNNTELEKRFWKKLEIFVVDPFDSTLKTHKLSGKLQESWSFSVEYDVRVIFYFAEDNKVVFIDFGTHDQVY